VKRTKVFGTLLAASLLVGVIWVATTQSASGADQKLKRGEGSWDHVNRAARNVKTNDRKAVQELVDQIFLDNGLDNHISASAASIKDRLIAAELDFHKGTHAGVGVEKVAASVNQLAERLNLPAFASTNVSEVKKVRLRMLTLYPALIGRGSAASRDDSKPHFDEKMSPIEAFHVAVTVIQQKVFNPEFQRTAQEQQAIDSQTKIRGQARIDKTAPFPDDSHGERTRQMMVAIRESANIMSFRDMLDQSEQSLDLLGIRR
jgi:hypothetical protein